MTNENAFGANTQALSRRTLMTGAAALACAVPVEGMAMMATPFAPHPEWLRKLLAEVDGLRDNGTPHLGHHDYVVVKSDRLEAIFEAADELRGG